ncbi:MAG TPA: hypothetical protein VJ729_14690 [Nitrososphaeraceae archaeon]|nr:hypothetical protein [Nitrososphaeraceae archaeon]
MKILKQYNKLSGLRKEIDRLSLQKYALDQACSRQSLSLIALSKLKNLGITEEQIISLGSTLQGNQIKR